MPASPGGTIGLQRLELGRGRGSIVPGHDGWCFWELDEPTLDVRVHLRAGDHAVDRLHFGTVPVIVRKRVRSSEIEATTLRAVAIGTLQKALSAADYRDVVEAARVDSSLPSFEPHLTSSVVARELASGARTFPLARDLTVVVPDMAGRPDSFYEDVAKAYLAAVVRHERPVEEMAKANRVPMSTINGWLQEARRRDRLRRNPNISDVRARSHASLVGRRPRDRGV